MESNMKNRFVNQLGAAADGDGAANTAAAACDEHANDPFNDELKASMGLLREKLDILRSMVDDDKEAGGSGGKHGPNAKSGPVFVDANILSAVFVLALAAILGATAYAFQGLYVAVRKRWTS